MYITKL